MQCSSHRKQRFHHSNGLKGNSGGTWFFPKNINYCYLLSSRKNPNSKQIVPCSQTLKVRVLVTLVTQISSSFIRSTGGLYYCILAYVKVKKTWFWAILSSPTHSQRARLLGPIVARGWVGWGRRRLLLMRQKMEPLIWAMGNAHVEDTHPPTHLPAQLPIQTRSYNGEIGGF